MREWESWTNNFQISILKLTITSTPEEEAEIWPSWRRITKWGLQRRYIAQLHMKAESPSLFFSFFFEKVNICEMNRNISVLLILNWDLYHLIKKASNISGSLCCLCFCYTILSFPSWNKFKYVSALRSHQFIINHGWWLEARTVMRYWGWLLQGNKATEEQQ